MLKKILSFRKRARDEKGRFVEDNPDTLKNEAYKWDVVNLAKFFWKSVKDNWIWLVLISLLVLIIAGSV